MDEVLEEFLAEMTETLEAVDVHLVKFEADPRDRSTLDVVFRLMHTLKGTCGFIGLPRLEAIAHAGENLLGLFREDSLAATTEAVTLVLRSVDRVKWLMSELARTGAEPEGEDVELITEIAAFVVSGASAPPAPAAEAPTPAGTAPAEAGVELVSGQGSIRVSVEMLERLMTTVTELVLNRNQLLQINRQNLDDAYSIPLQRLSQITTEVQDAVMRMRLQPVGGAWKKLPRLVRDISAELGKDIRLVMDGEAAELDRQVLELIRDPLTHMVRNAAGHGIEQPGERIAAGKPAHGTISLSAFHQGGSLVIRMADDGRGLDTAAIRAKAVEKGLLAAAEAEELSEAQAHRLILAPGFSTAEAVTNLSGRGVGMDVVRANIEQIGGQIDLSSTPGQGVLVTLRIPLTLAIISALIVSAGGRRFAAPQAGVSEVVRVGSGSGARIETVDGAMLMRLRESLLPVVSLSASLGLQGGEARGHVLVMQAGTRRFGLLVEAVLDTEEIVVKPLPGPLRDIRLLSGATILGDGSIALIVDSDALAELAQPVEAVQADVGPASEQDTARREPLLLFRAGAGALKAVELAEVTRLERIAPSMIERAGERSVLQLRGELMPVLTLDGGLAGMSGEPFQPMLILSDDQGGFALAVDEIVDVVEDRLQIELAAGEPGLLGSAVVQGQAVQVLDLHWCRAHAGMRRLVRPADPSRERAA